MNVILGGGLSGLAAGYALAQAGAPVTLIERDAAVGGLAKTVSHGAYKFDLGGHRFLSDNVSLNRLVAELLGPDLLTVPRTSQIYMADTFFDYPLSPVNAIFGLGLGTTARILADYCKEKIAGALLRRCIISLEDWVVAQFGRAMFDLYFKEYSEKVWGIDCSQISMDWVAKRIDGLSLWQTIKHAIFRSQATRVKTLTDSFLYPRHGIGQIAEKLHEAICRENQVRTGTSVETIYCQGDRVECVFYKDLHGKSAVKGREYISSIPLTVLLDKIDPKPPYHVMKAASEIRFRSLVIAAIMLKRDKMTDLTWMYLPGKEIPFGRIHEPKNWSRDMAPQGRAHVVAEYFCNQDDPVWNAADEALVADTTGHLVRLGFFEESDVVDHCVLRVPHAYPVFSVGYEQHVKVITDYLGQFSNLHLAGRSGLYSYLNMDHAMESGMAVAADILRKHKDGAKVCSENREAKPYSLLRPTYSCSN